MHTAGPIHISCPLQGEAADHAAQILGDENKVGAAEPHLRDDNAPLREEEGYGARTEEGHGRMARLAKQKSADFRGSTTYLDDKTPWAAPCSRCHVTIVQIERRQVFLARQRLAVVCRL